MTQRLGPFAHSFELDQSAIEVSAQDLGPEFARLVEMVEQGGEITKIDWTFTENGVPEWTAEVVMPVSTP